MTCHQTREVRLFGLYRDAVNGEHFSVIKSGKWSDLIPYLNAVVRMCGPRQVFVERSNDGKLIPIMSCDL